MMSAGIVNFKDHSATSHATTFISKPKTIWLVEGKEKPIKLITPLYAILLINVITIIYNIVNIEYRQYLIRPEKLQKNDFVFLQGWEATYAPEGWIPGRPAGSNIRGVQHVNCKHAIFVCKLVISAICMYEYAECREGRQVE